MSFFHSLLLSNQSFIPGDEYQAVLNRATNISAIIPSQEQQIKQDTLLSGISSDGDLTEMDYLFVLLNQGSENFARINWKNPTGSYALTNVGDVEWFSNQGSKSTTTGAYETGFNPGVAGFVGKFLRNNNSFGVYVIDEFKTSFGAMGVHLVNSSGQGWQVGPRFETSGGADNVLKGQDNNGTFSQVGTGMSTSIGLTSVRRNNSGNYDVLRNGVVIGTVTAASQVVVDLVSFICGVTTFPFGQGAAQRYSIPYGGLVAAAFTGSASIDHLRVYNRFATYFADPYGLSMTAPSNIDIDLHVGSQSNGSGRGIITGLSKTLQSPLTTLTPIWSLEKHKFEIYQAWINSLSDDTFVVSPGFHGWETTYLNRFAELGRQRGMVKITKPATWLANKADATLTWSHLNTNPGNLFSWAVTETLAFKALYPNANIKNIFIHHGEYDGLTSNPADASAYQTNRQNWLTAFFSATGISSSTPVTLIKPHTNITEGGDDFHYTPEVNAAIDAIAAASPTTRFSISTDAYDGSMIHIESAGLQALGISLANYIIARENP